MIEKNDEEKRESRELKSGVMMQKKWVPVVIENLRSEEFDEVVYEQLIEEVAEIIYADICQLQKNQIPDSFNDENHFYQRTGTDA